MGNSCSSCCGDKVSQHKELMLQDAPILSHADFSAKLPVKPSVTSSQLPARNCTKLQSSLRGYSAKKFARSLQAATRSYQQVVSGRSDVRPLIGDIIDYTNDDVQRTLRQIGEFVFNQDMDAYGPVTRRAPMELESGSIYTGEWNNNDMRHGRGKQYWTDGSIYEGYWKNDQANGHGRLIHADGDYYEGFWANDQANGTGKYVHSDGSQFEGFWKDDKQDGYGIEIWPDGACYKGNYDAGQKHGMGSFSWADGSRYEGQFLDNNIHGHGTYTWGDGRIYKGQWKDNKMDGMGEFTWTDGRKYTGNYINDKKEGFGIFQWPNMRRYEGNWKDGKQHGEGSFISEKGGQKRRGLWKNGVRLQWIKEESDES